MREPKHSESVDLICEFPLKIEVLRGSSRNTRIDVWPGGFDYVLLAGAPGALPGICALWGK